MSRKSWKIAAGVITILVATVIYISGSLEKIPPGHVGVSVIKCGHGGVDKDPIPTGYYWKGFFCEDVVIYATSMQSLILTGNHYEGRGGPDGQEEDQHIDATSVEGLPIKVDVAFNFTIEPSKVPEIYQKYRLRIPELEHLYLRQTIREGVQNTFAQYTAQQLYSDKKEVARAEIEAFITKQLKPIGILPAQLTLNRIEPPKSVTDAINAKVEMDQQAQKAEAEVRKKRAEASQEVAVAEGRAKAVRAAAEGEAQSITLRAEAQAKANKILAESLTPTLIEYQRVVRWNGALPSVTGGVAPMIQVTGQGAGQTSPR